MVDCGPNFGPNSSARCPFWGRNVRTALVLAGRDRSARAMAAANCRLCLFGCRKIRRPAGIFTNDAKQLGDRINLRGRLARYRDNAFPLVPAQPSKESDRPFLWLRKTRGSLLTHLAFRFAFLPKPKRALTLHGSCKFGCKLEKLAAELIDVLRCRRAARPSLARATRRQHRARAAQVGAWLAGPPPRRERSRGRELSHR